MVTSPTTAPRTRSPTTGSASVLPGRLRPGPAQAGQPLRLSGHRNGRKLVIVCSHLDSDRHPLTDPSYVADCRDRLARDGALVLARLLRTEIVEQVAADALPREPDAFYANSTHNVFLTPPDSTRATTDPFNRQVLSTKGLIADDQIADDSPLRDIYGDSDLQAFLCGVLGIDAIYPYADDVSSINVHFAAAGMELGWHFDNSSFAVTMLLQQPDDGGHFQYVPRVRNADNMNVLLNAILDGESDAETLAFAPGDLVLFRGRNALHRVTPTEGATTRLLVVFAYNDEPGIALSDSALQTFYGRTAAP